MFAFQLRRGAAARASGGPTLVPVGKTVLGRRFDAIGEPADRGSPSRRTSPDARSIPRRRRRSVSAARRRSSSPGSRSLTGRGHWSGAARRDGRQRGCGHGRGRWHGRDGLDHGTDPHNRETPSRGLPLRQPRRSLRSSRRSAPTAHPNDRSAAASLMPPRTAVPRTWSILWDKGMF